MPTKSNVFSVIYQYKKAIVQWLRDYKTWPHILTPSLIREPSLGHSQILSVPRYFVYKIAITIPSIRPLWGLSELMYMKHSCTPLSHIEYSVDITDYCWWAIWLLPILTYNQVTQNHLLLSNIPNYNVLCRVYAFVHMFFSIKMTSNLVLLLCLSF